MLGGVSSHTRCSHVFYDSPDRSVFATGVSLTTSKGPDRKQGVLFAERVHLFCLPSYSPPGRRLERRRTRADLDLSPWGLSESMWIRACKTLGCQLSPNIPFPSASTSPARKEAAGGTGRDT